MPQTEEKDMQKKTERFIDELARIYTIIAKELHRKESKDNQPYKT